MPYKIRKQGEQFCVFKEGDGGPSKKIACHDTQAGARRQQNALYAAERDESREFNTKQRKQAAGQGQAMPGGGFPIKNEQDLRNAIQAFGRAKNKAAAKAHIIRRAKALGKTSLLPKGWLSSGGDKASAGRIDCPEDDCGRLFLNEDQLYEHAEAVHTFGEIRLLVSQAAREKWGGGAGPDRAWVWVDDLANDWVVVEVEEGGSQKLLKASYSITDNRVTLGEGTEVVRRMVYEPVGTKED